MARKTADVETIKARCNHALSDPYTVRLQSESMGFGEAKTYRLGVAAVLETVLHDTDNYHGFQYKDGALGRTDETIRNYF